MKVISVGCSWESKESKANAFSDFKRLNAPTERASLVSAITTFDTPLRPGYSTILFDNY